MFRWQNVQTLAGRKDPDLSQNLAAVKELSHLESTHSDL
jgi:hypothetical protein